MKDDFPHDGINISHIKIDGGFAALIFTVGSMATFLFGIPALWYFFVAAIALGLGIAVVLHLLYR